MKINNTLFACILLIMTVSHVNAQSDKNICYKVGIGTVEYAVPEQKTTVGSIIGGLAEAALTGKNTSQLPEYADAVKASVVTGIGNAMRLTVMEDTSMEHDYLLSGTISNISATTRIEAPVKKGTPGNEYFKVLVSVTANISNASNGEVIDSHLFRVSDSDLGWMGSKDKAMSEALAILSKRVASYYNSLFPLHASVVERGDIDKDKQKTVYIDLGSALNVSEGMQFDVYSVREIAGKEARTEIGRLKISKVMGEDISLCKVTKGDKQLKTALDNNEILVVTSRK